jgi:ubiquinone/menaquinone biosynthesis C-methylase UbiE
MKLKLNLGAGSHPLEGFENLDKPWTYESGLPYKDENVEAITISHSLMYVAEKNYPFVFKEFYRVLKPNGRLRITEDDTENPKSERYGGYFDAVSLTSKKMIDNYAKGFKEVDNKDKSLIQEFHGKPPKVFQVEYEKN